MTSELVFSRWLAISWLLLMFVLSGCNQPDRPTAKAPPAASAEKAPVANAPAEKLNLPSQQDTAESSVNKPALESGKAAKPEAPLGGTAESTKPATQSGASAVSPEPALPQQPEQPAEVAAEERPGFMRDEEEELPFPFEIPQSWKRLSEKEEIWIDSQAKLVAVSGRICLTRGLLEMFACPKGTKEHESIVATKPWAMYIHQALLLAGINPGRTVQWEPDYKAAEGPRIDVEVWYFNAQKELVKKNAKEMVRLVSDGSPLKIDWVFGGSKFITDPDGRELYAANGGEMVCLSNFSSAMIDLPIPSTAEAGGLLFEANPDQVPPLNTPVLLVLKAQTAQAEPEAVDKGK